MSTVTDEIRKSLTDLKPIYALAGAGDFAAEKLRDAPTLLAEAAGTVTTLATRIAVEAPERLAKVQSTVQTRLAEVPGALDPRSVVATLDPRTARESIRGAVDPQALRERAQSIALVQVGRVLEAAGKAVETYDGLAERGKTVVERYLGNSDVKASDVTVVVEQVVVDEAPADAKTGEPEAKIEDAAVKETTEEPAAAAAKPQAKKTTSAPRKRAATASAAKNAKA
jgi:hypothetical protein